MYRNVVAVFAAPGFEEKFRPPHGGKEQQHAHRRQRQRQQPAGKYPQDWPVMYISKAEPIITVALMLTLFRPVEQGTPEHRYVQINEPACAIRNLL